MNSKRWTRKLKGEFYTKPHVVDFIVQNTVDACINNQAHLLKQHARKNNVKNMGKTLETVLNVKILDPACGDGVFLERCLASFQKFYQTYNRILENGRFSSLMPIEFPYLTALVNNIHGIDNDPDAVIECKKRFKIFEAGNVPEAIVEKILEMNIKQGHSLIPGINGLNISDLPNEGKSVIILRKQLKNVQIHNQFDDFIKIHDELLKNKKIMKKKLISRVLKDEFDAETSFNPFFWNLEFPEIINSGGFDFIVGNPPYIRVHKQDKRTKSFLQKNYFVAKYDFDIYVCFIELSLHLLKQHGILSFITSDKFLSRRYGKKLRTLILNNAILQEFVDISRCPDSFTVNTYPTIFRLKKMTGEIIKTSNIVSVYNNEILIHCVKNSAESGLRALKDKIGTGDISSGTINQELFYENPNMEFRLNFGPLTSLMNDKIDSFPKLKKVVQKQQLYCGTPRAKDYHGWKKNIVEKPTVKQPSLRFLVCRNITPYAINFGIPINAFHQKYSTPYFIFSEDSMTTDRWKKFKTVPKILIRGNDTRITAALDDEGSVFIGMYGMIQREFDPRYLIGILNSRLINAYFFDRNPSIRIRGNFFSINSSHLFDLPIVLPNREQEMHLSRMVQEMMTICQEEYKTGFNDEKTIILKSKIELDEEINQAVFDLYDISNSERELIKKTIKNIPRMQINV
ncbi:MAG: Eco57I restriction-modification methylase domain-containing protein [Candidatus Helarchaeota archaeon]